MGRRTSRPRRRAWPELQATFEPERFGVRIVVVAFAFCETEGPIQLDRRGELGGGIGVEFHERVSRFACFLKEALDEETAESRSARGRPDVQAFHFADVFPEGGKRAEGDAAGGFVVVEGEEQAAAGRGVEAWERLELVLESLVFERASGDVGDTGAVLGYENAGEGEVRVFRCELDDVRCRFGVRHGTAIVRGRRSRRWLTWALFPHM